MNDEILIELGEVSEETRGKIGPALEGGSSEVEHD